MRLTYGWPRGLKQYPSTILAEVDFVDLTATLLK